MQTFNSRPGSASQSTLRAAAGFSPLAGIDQKRARAQQGSGDSQHAGQSCRTAALSSTAGSEPVAAARSVVEGIGFFGDSLQVGSIGPGKLNLT